MKTASHRTSVLHSRGAVLLISCYELGHRPIGLTRPLRALETAGFAPDTLDIAVEPFDAEKVLRARFIGIAVPMHTALRLGVHLLARIRDINPDATLCMYGLYAALNAEYLRAHRVDFCLSGTDETKLVALVQKLAADAPTATAPSLNAPTAELPPLEMYAGLEEDNVVRTVGYTETTHGCKHLCTHCPIPPVYGGRFSAVPRETVLAEIQEQVDAGATHITFGDPDFLNGPTHGLRILRAMHAMFPNLTFDFTTKIEHILKNADYFPEFAQLGCRFVISAVEALSEPVLTILEKNHTQADVEDALGIVHGAGIALRPTWVPFTPWSTLADYLDILRFVETHRLVYHVDPVQYAVRLLIPPGSRLLERPETQALAPVLDAAAFSYRWTHTDPRMDELHKRVTEQVEADAGAAVDTAETFYQVWRLAAERTGEPPPKQTETPHPHAPRLTETWFC